MLAAIGLVAGVLWIAIEYNPIFVFGAVAVLWLLALMLRGVFSKPFKPFDDDDPSQRGVAPPAASE